MNNSIAEILLEAHVTHELNRFSNKAYITTIEEEVSAVFDWLHQIQLHDITTPEQINNLIQRIVVEHPIAGGITEIMGEMSQIVFKAPINAQTVLEDIFPRRQFDDIIDKIVSLKYTRDEIISRLMESSAYLTLISNVMYQSIKGYIFTENLLAQKTPRLYALIKMGKTAAKQKIPKLSDLESAIDKRLERYIENTLDKTIHYSKGFLKEFINESLLVATGEEIWKNIAQGSLAEYFKKIDANDLEDFIIIGYEFWLNFRNTPYFHEIYKTTVNYFFEKYGDTDLDLIVEEMGVTKEMVIKEVCEVVSPGIEKGLEMGYIEERIRERLASFYHSSETTRLLASLGAQDT